VVYLPQLKGGDLPRLPEILIEQSGSTNLKRPLVFEEDEDLILIDNLNVVGGTVKVNAGKRYCL
jgi:hypothetical protein